MEKIQSKCVCTHHFLTPPSPPPFAPLPCTHLYALAMTNPLLLPAYLLYGWPLKHIIHAFIHNFEIDVKYWYSAILAFKKGLILIVVENFLYFIFWKKNFRNLLVLLSEVIEIKCLHSFSCLINIKSSFFL